MGKVYKRLILNTLEPNEDYIHGLIRVYNNEICDVIDNYNSSAYYEPSPTIAGHIIIILITKHTKAILSV